MALRPLALGIEMTCLGAAEPGDILFCNISQNLFSISNDSLRGVGEVALAIITRY